MIETVRDHWVVVYWRSLWTRPLIALMRLWYWIHPFLALTFGGGSLYLAGWIMTEWRGADVPAGPLAVFSSIGLLLSWRALIVVWPGLAPFAMVEGPIEDVGPDGQGGLVLAVAGWRWTVPVEVAQDVRGQDHVRLWVGMPGLVHALYRREFRPVGMAVPTTPIASASPGTEQTTGNGQAPGSGRWRRIFVLSRWSEGHMFGLPLIAAAYMTWMLLRLFISCYQEGLSPPGDDPWQFALLMVAMVPVALALMGYCLSRLWRMSYGLVMPTQAVIGTITSMETKGDTGVVDFGSLRWELPAEACQMLAVGDVVRVTYRALSLTVLYVDVGLAGGERQPTVSGRAPGAWR